MAKVPRQAFELQRELIMEANAQLGLLKFPESSYGEYKELIKATIYKMFKEDVYGGQEPRLAQKIEKIQQVTMQETGVYTQLSDGSVPSFEKFKAIKQKIQNSNNNSKMSPLTRQEKQQQTIDQYMKLEQMVNDLTRDRVRVL